jgi:hypothetical protein
LGGNCCNRQILKQTVNRVLVQTSDEEATPLSDFAKEGVVVVASVEQVGDAISNPFVKRLSFATFARREYQTFG